MSKLQDDIYQRFHGFKPVKREYQKQGQSAWYYIDPRYDGDKDKRSQIDVANENSPNPKLNDILAEDMHQNPQDYYIWRTKGDDKVREAHAEREGKIFNKHIPPEGGNPGEDYNCRCWAEPYRPERYADKPIIVDVSGILPENTNKDKKLPEGSYTTELGNMTTDVPIQFVKNGENKEQNSKQIFDEIYYSKIDTKGNILYKGTDKHEGGFSDRINDLGGKTTYGITQFSLDEYNSWNHPFKKGIDFPKDVKQLTSEQSKQILYEMYYKRYGINLITNIKIARNVFDEEMNQGTAAGFDLVSAINEYKNKKFPYNNIISNNLAESVNSLSEKETTEMNDILTQKRMNRYFYSVDKHPEKNINNLRGWYNRASTYYSNPEIFENLYKSKVD